MSHPEKRLPQNAVLRERIDRLQALHTQLQTLTSEAFRDVLRQVRGAAHSDARQALDAMIRGYIETLHQHQLRIEQEFSLLSQANLISDEELAALIDVPPFVRNDNGSDKP
jgi:predicted RNase H-like HicB family nuclease